MVKRVVPVCAAVAIVCIVIVGLLFLNIREDRVVTFRVTKISGDTNARVDIHWDCKNSYGMIGNSDMPWSHAVECLVGEYVTLEVEPSLGHYDPSLVVRLEFYYGYYDVTYEADASDYGSPPITLRDLLP